MQHQKAKLILDRNLVRMQQKVMFESEEMMQHLEDLLAKVAMDNEICEDTRLDSLEGIEEILSEVMTLNKYVETTFRQPYINERIGQGEHPQIFFEC